jgi:ABC-type multidrug transport system fused ATPase/permease subunit
VQAANGRAFRRYRQNLRRILPYLRPHWQFGLASAVLTGLGVLGALIEPWPLAFLVDSVLGEKPPAPIITSVIGTNRTHLIILASLATLVVTLLVNLVALAQEYVQTKLAQQMTLEFRSDLFRHAQRISLDYHDENRIGVFIARINMESPAVGTIICAIPTTLQSLFTLVGMLYVSFRLDSTLALLSLTVVPFIYSSTGYYGNRIEPRVLKVRNLEGQSLNIAHEAISMQRLIVAFNRESHEQEKFYRQGQEATRARVTLTVRQMLFALVVNLTTAAGTALVLGVGAYHALHGRITAGQLLVVLSYIRQVYQPLEQISSMVSGLQNEFVNLQGALDLLDVVPDVQERPDAVAVQRVRGHVTFRDVDFSYRNRPETIKHVSFDVQPGETVALVGATGAGKSTLASLLLRFYDPAEGQILLDEVDIRELTLGSLRQNISVVLQEPLLFSMSIADNIRYGRLDATDEEVVEAARSAGADRFISALPDGYGTRLGERGSLLSGGERQRICVARAFLKNAPILILDEPTSSVDYKTEAVILDSLDRLMQGRTTFVIAHRLSTIRGADKILVVDQGCVVEDGTHERLLELGGLYRELHDLQHVPDGRVQ